MVQLPTGQRLNNADRCSYQLVNAVWFASLPDVLSSATRAFRVPAEVTKEVPLSSNTALTGLTFEDYGIDWLFP